MEGRLWAICFPCSLFFPVIQPSHSTRMVEQKSVQMKKQKVKGPLLSFWTQRDDYGWALTFMTATMHTVQKIIWLSSTVSRWEVVGGREVSYFIAEMSMKCASCAELRRRMDAPRMTRAEWGSTYVSPFPISTHSSTRRLSKTLRKKKERKEREKEKKWGDNNDLSSMLFISCCMHWDVRRFRQSWANGYVVISEGPRVCLSRQIRGVR